MYTKQYYEGEWEICTPDGDVLITVAGEITADILLSHLNR